MHNGVWKSSRGFPRVNSKGLEHVDLSGIRGVLRQSTGHDDGDVDLIDIGHFYCRQTRKVNI